jgi:hypothetical protein
MCRDWCHTPTQLFRSLRRWGSVLLYVLCFSFTACGDASTAQALQTVTSWAATAHLVGDAWMAHAVPQAYVVQTLRHARRQLHTQRRTLESHPPSAPAEARAALAGHLQSLEHTVHQMLTAVRQGDTPLGSGQVWVRLPAQMPAQQEGREA